MCYHLYTWQITLCYLSTKKEVVKSSMITLFHDWCLFAGLFVLYLAHLSHLHPLPDLGSVNYGWNILMRSHSSYFVIIRNAKKPTIPQNLYVNVGGTSDKPICKKKTAKGSLFFHNLNKLVLGKYLQTSKHWMCDWVSYYFIEDRMAKISLKYCNTYPVHCLALFTIVCSIKRRAITLLL